MRSKQRLLSLDVFRGITIALMIVVNTTDDEYGYAWLTHASWHGCHLADLVFPFFLFIVGVSISCAFSNTRNVNQSLTPMISTIAHRTLILLLLGLALNAFPHFYWVNLRYYGVLQRIALCYFGAALLFLRTTIRTQIGILLLLLVSYWLVLSWGDLTPVGNLPARLDRLLFSSQHLYGKVYDPEGLLSTLPALATTLLGTITGVILLESHPSYRIAKKIFWSGIGFLVFGWLWHKILPFNKALWTSSYVIWTGGLALTIFACCYTIIDIWHCTWWTKPFIIFGVNAIAAFVLHVIVIKLHVTQHIDVNHVTMSLRTYFIHSLAHYMSWPLAALGYTLISLLLWLGVFTIFYRYKLFIKI